MGYMMRPPPRLTIGEWIMGVLSFIFLYFIMPVLMVLGFVLLLG
jgi:hypothetical protein